MAFNHCDNERFHVYYGAVWVTEMDRVRFDVTINVNDFVYLKLMVHGF